MNFIQDFESLKLYARSLVANLKADSEYCPEKFKLNPELRENLFGKSNTPSASVFADKFDSKVLKALSYSDSSVKSLVKNFNSSAGYNVYYLLTLDYCTTKLVKDYMKLSSIYDKLNTEVVKYNKYGRYIEGTELGSSIQNATKVLTDSEMSTFLEELSDTYYCKEINKELYVTLKSTHDTLCNVKELYDAGRIKVVSGCAGSGKSTATLKELIKDGCSFTIVTLAHVIRSEDVRKCISMGLNEVDSAVVAGLRVRDVNSFGEYIVVDEATQLDVDAYGVLCTILESRRDIKLILMGDPRQLRGFTGRCDIFSSLILEYKINEEFKTIYRCSDETYNELILDMCKKNSWDIVKLSGTDTLDVFKDDDKIIDKYVEMFNNTNKSLLGMCVSNSYCAACNQAVLNHLVNYKDSIYNSSFRSSRESGTKVIYNNISLIDLDYNVASREKLVLPVICTENHNKDGWASSEIMYVDFSNRRVFQNRDGSGKRLNWELVVSLRKDLNVCFFANIFCSQGTTFDDTFVLIDNVDFKAPNECNSIYVALTRHKFKCNLFVRGEFKPFRSHYYNNFKEMAIFEV